jgi:hypothetical protein
MCTKTAAHAINLLAETAVANYLLILSAYLLLRAKNVVLGFNVSRLEIHFTLSYAGCSVCYHPLFNRTSSFYVF